MFSGRGGGRKTQPAFDGLTHNVRAAPERSTSPRLFSFVAENRPIILWHLLGCSVSWVVELRQFADLPEYKAPLHFLFLADVPPPPSSSTRTNSWNLWFRGAVFGRERNTGDVQTKSNSLLSNKLGGRVPQQEWSRVSRWPRTPWLWCWRRFARRINGTLPHLHQQNSTSNITAATTCSPVSKPWICSISGTTRWPRLSPRSSSSAGSPSVCCSSRGKSFTCRCSGTAGPGGPWNHHRALTSRP